MKYMLKNGLILLIKKAIDMIKEVYKEILSRGRLYIYIYIKKKNLVNISKFYDPVCKKTSKNSPRSLRKSLNSNK